MVSYRFNTIIFDLDGTLVDSLSDIAEAANSALAALGFPAHPKEKYRRFVGDGLTTLAERIVPAGSDKSQISETVRQFKIIYQTNWARNSGPYPGIMTMLNTLAAHPVNLAVLSNKPDDFTQLFVARFFPGSMFGQVIGNRENLPKKPDPTGAFTIADYFQVESASCLLVGDSSVDIMTGKSAGMTTMGVTWGFRERQELEESGADIIIDQPSEILSYVLIDR